MDQLGQDLFNVTSTSPLQRNENLDIESLLIGIPRSPFPGENNNGVKSEKHRDGQTLTRDHAGHNKTPAAEGTERATCLQNATQVVLEQRSSESWRAAENEGKKRLFPGKLAKERAGREDSAEGEPCGETSGCASATGGGDVESASAMSGSGGSVDSASDTGGGSVDSASTTGGGARGVQGGSATGGGGSGVDSASTTGGGSIASGTKGARGTAAAAMSTNGMWPSAGGVGRAPGGVCGQRVGAGASAERESPGRRSGGGPGDAVRVEAESPSAAELQSLSRGLVSPGQTDGSSCSFGSSLCFSAPPSGDDGEPVAVQRVVNSQRQINNSAVDEQEDLPAAHWSLEPLGDDCPEAQGEPPDLVIEVAGRRIRAHQAVLAARSDYFRARCGRRQLALRGLSLVALRPLLDYAYGGDLSLLAAPGGGLAEAAEVLAAARLLQMPGAAQRCAEALEARLELGNCLALLGLAQRQRLAGLRRATYRFMSDHYLAVLREPAVYGRLSGAERELILRRREAEAGGGERCLVLADLNDVYERPLGGGGSSRPESRESSRPQSPELGCSPTADSERWLYRHDANSTDDQWKPLSRLPEAAARSRGCGLCAMHNYLFVAGGLCGGGGEQAGASDRVFAYNAATGGWAEVRPMCQARSQLKLVALDGLLYAVGGECLLSVERYDPRADRWSPVAPLPRGAFAVAHQAVACSGRIYVSGGSLFHRLLCYDPRRDEWVECPGSRGGGSRARSRAGGGGGGSGGGGRWAYLVARGHCLYRFELDRGQRALSVCRYNTVARLWSECTALQPPQPQLLLPFRCALLGRAIYCINRGCTLRFMLAEDEQAAAAADGTLGAFDSLLLQPCAEAKGLLFPIILTLPEKPHKKP